MISPQSAPPLYMSRQALLWCLRCGRQRKLRRGLCSPCYAREIRNQRYFRGLCPRVLARDHGACRACGRPGSGNGIHVHHRRPGVTHEKFLISLCPGHHAMIHRLEVVDRILPALALELWREQHPVAWEQLALHFDLARDSGPISFRQFWEVPG